MRLAKNGHSYAIPIQTLTTTAFAFAAPSDDFVTNLLAGDFAQTIIAMYVSPMGQFFYLLVAILFFVPLYLKTKSIVLPMVVWLLLGGSFLAIMPIISPIALMLTILGVAGIIVSLFFRQGGEYYE